MRYLMVLAASAFFAAGCGNDNGGEVQDAGLIQMDATTSDGGSNCLIDSTFSSIFTKVLNTHTCFDGGCHGAFPGGGLAFNMDKASARTALLGDTVNAPSKAGFPKRVVPGNAAQSFLHEKLTNANVPLGIMPLGAAKLPDCEIAAIDAWIQGGALDN